jgi:exo-beta-1,3-glucanase (GH17 family)
MNWVRICILLLLTGCQNAPPTNSIPANQQLAEATSSNHAFLSYLTDNKTPPALIAYSPTHFNPRQGKKFRLPSPSSIEYDLRELRAAFDGLILYGYHPDITPIILEKALALHYRAVMLGVWDPRAPIEVRGVVTLINKYAHQLAIALCIGNEGISFHRYTMVDLMRTRDKIRSMLTRQIAVPITTSEPLSAYQQSELHTFGFFLAPNIHPVFDQPTLAAMDAVTWTRTQALELMEKFHKPVLVKETGFPHGGSQRFTPHTQEKFWDAYVNANRLVYSSTHPAAWASFATSFEAFSQPWKAEESNLTIEAAWGLMNEARKPFPAFHTWRRHHVAARQKRHTHQESEKARAIRVILE